MTFHQWFMMLARTVAMKSKDPTTQVGCLVVGPDGEHRASGYNGIPRGVLDKPERMERPAKYLWTSHAEENAVAQAARVGIPLKGCTAYVTHHPCARCARSLIQAGIVCVYVGPGTTSMPVDEFNTAGTMFAEAGVALQLTGIPDV